MGKYFGTDGFRGEANVNLTPEHAYKVGRFLGWYYSKDNHKARIVIAKDTRKSGYMLEYAIISGLLASGADVYRLHVTTTPNVSYSILDNKFDCGIMMSASHNPYYDNGIKLVNKYGEKMDEETILLIEKYIDNELKEKIDYANKDNIGRIIDFTKGRDDYKDHLVSLAKYDFKGYNICLDCANGSSFSIAKEVFDKLGANTKVINNKPNGTNINVDCGSTHIESLVEYVKTNHMDAGFAFDGDADRCLAIDNLGNIINGDHIIYILANYLKNNNELNDNTVVSTILSNLGLYNALNKVNIDYKQTKVGDKYVYENMKKNNFSLGGEQSGHIILSKYAQTGDGILTAIKLMEAMIESKQSLHELAKDVVMLPQVLKNVKVANKKAVLENKAVLDIVEKLKKELDKSGRIILRESGTEPVIRVMVEAKDLDTCNNYANRVITTIKKENLAI